MVQTAEGKKQTDRTNYSETPFKRGKVAARPRPGPATLELLKGG